MSANFSPKPHVDGDLSMSEPDNDEELLSAQNRTSLPCNTSLQPNSESNTNMLMPAVRDGVASSEYVQRAMTPVIGSFGHKELSDEPLST